MKTYGGLIRWNFGLPLALAIFALVCYAFFLMDQHLRWWIERSATDLNGAEVDIGSLKTSISGLYLEIQKLQFTDPDAAAFNRLEIGKMRFDLSLTGLLRGKLIIEDATMQDIQIHSKRRKPGRVLPPPPVALANQAGPGPRFLRPLEDSILANALAVLKSQAGNPLKNFVWDELPSQLALKQLNGEWNQKQQLMQAALSSLPQTKDFQEIRAEAAAIAMPEDPLRIPSSLATIEVLKAKTQNHHEKLESVNQQMKNEGSALVNRVKNLDEFLKQDLVMISQKVKLIDLDFTKLAEDICGPEIKKNLKILEVYYARVRPYLDSKEHPSGSRVWRLAGTDVSFPERPGLPGFWLKKMQISSKETADGPLGDLLGKITDLSSAPALVAQPTLLQFAGSFRQLGIEGLVADAILDHRQAIGRDEIKIAIADFPIADRMLTESKDYVLGFYQAKASLRMNFFIEGDSLKLEFETYMNKLSWKVESDSERIKSLLDSVFGPLSQVNIRAKADGSWQNLRWNVSSNLVDQLQQALEKELSRPRVPRHFLPLIS